jgi:hypothetical protein
VVLAVVGVEMMDQKVRKAVLGIVVVRLRWDHWDHWGGDCSHVLVDLVGADLDVLPYVHLRVG